MARSKTVSERLAGLSPEKRALLLEKVRRAGRASGGDPGIPRREDPGRAPLSFAQERLWRFTRAHPGSTIHNVYHGVRLRGALDVRAFTASFDLLVRRHEVLRARLPLEDGGPVARFDAPAPSPRLPVIDLGRFDAGEPGRAFGAPLDRAIRQVAAVPFRLERGPLVKPVLLRGAGGESIFLLVLHHIVTDGWSLSLLVTELAELYAAHRRGEPPVPVEPALRYGDFAAWQRGQAGRGSWGEALDFWRRRLAGWRGDPSRCGAVAARGGSETLVLDGESSRRIRALARRSRATLFTTLLAAFKVFLYRLTGEPDVVVATPAAGRGRDELEGVAGLFLNLLPLRTGLHGNPTFIELLARVRETALEAFAHADVPCEVLLRELGLERDDGLPPFRTLFNLPSHGAGEDEPLAAGDLTFDPFLTGEVGSEFDLVFYAVEQRDGLRLHFACSGDPFKAGTSSLLGLYRDLLLALTARPETRLDAADGA